MKRPKKVSKKRPSLWIRSNTLGAVRILYPDGKVEFLCANGSGWLHSAFTYPTHELSAARLKKTHVFLGNI